MERLKPIDEIPNDDDGLYDFLREEMLDANSMENEDFDNLEDSPVLDYKEKEIGVISKSKRKRYGTNSAKS